MKSIRSKIIIVSCLICILSILATTIINYKVLSSNILSQTLVRVKESSNKYAVEIDGWFAVQGRILDEIYSEIMYDDDFDKEHLIDYFEYKKETNSDIIEYYIAFSDNVFVTNNGLWIPEGDYNCLEKDWYKKACESDGVVVSSPYIDSNHGQVIVTVAKAIRKDGTITGVLCSDIAIDHIVNMINSAKPSKESYGFLIDDNGNILAHPNKKFIFSKEKGLVNITDVYNEDLLNIHDNEKQGRKPIKDYDGEEKYFLYTHAKFTGWNVGFSVPVKEVREPLKNVIDRTILLAMVLTAISVVLTFIFGNSFSKPIKSATQYIEQIADLDIRNDVDEEYINRSDEIGRMFRSFQLIVSSLREFLKNLRDISERVASFSEELASSSQQASVAADNVAEVSSTLAEMSDSQLKEISSVINAMEKMSLSIHEVLNNTNISNAETLSNIKSIANKGQEIVDVSNQIKDISKFVSGQIKNVSSLTEEQMTSMEEISSASQCLAELAQELNEYIDNFKS